MRQQLALPVLLGLLAAGPFRASDTYVRFDPGAVPVGPFPSDFLTVADARQHTALRVQLPKPDCNVEVTQCMIIDRLNQLDGFSIFPRLRVAFSGPVDASSLKDGIFLVAMDRLTRSEAGVHREGETTAINQVIYDAATRTVFAKPNRVLDQQTRYLLVATDAVKDEAGDPVQASPEFLACLSGAGPQPYCEKLREAVALAAERADPRRIVAASLFTTMSATSRLEMERDLLPAVPPNAGPAAPGSFIRPQEVSGAAWTIQRYVSGPLQESTPPSTAGLPGIGAFALGEFDSPSILDQRGVLQLTPTAEPLAPALRKERISYAAFLPATEKPDAGYPVVIAAHGGGDSLFGIPMLVSGLMALKGMATVGISAFGHGYGPGGQFRIRYVDQTEREFPVRGRAVDVNGDGFFGQSEGCGPPTAPGGQNDCQMQTALDLMQLVRAIRQGIDLDGDGSIDLDPNRISLFGYSMGAMYGAVFAALEPGIQTAVLNSGGGPSADALRWRVDKNTLRILLAARIPSLLNLNNDFDENYVFRDQPVKVNQIRGAIEIQDYLEQLEWAFMNGDPLAYVPHLALLPPSGAAPKRVLWQLALGDQSVPNAAASNLIRESGLTESVTLYRHDRARASGVTILPYNPHEYIWWLDLPPRLPAEWIAAATLAEAAQFLWDGSQVDVNAMVRPVFGMDLFETPVRLPEGPVYEPR